MSLSMSSWDRWAPAAYLFVIGITVVFVTGLGMGLTSGGGQGVIYMAFLPILVIIVLFVAFVVLSKGIGNRLKI